MMYLCGFENCKYRFIIKISGFKSTKVFGQPSAALSEVADIL